MTRVIYTVIIAAMLVSTVALNVAVINAVHFTTAIIQFHSEILAEFIAAIMALNIEGVTTIIVAGTAAALLPQ